MRVVSAVELSEVDFSRYGKVIRLRAGSEDVVTSRGDGWSGVHTTRSVLARAGSLGYTVATPLPAEVRRMERHHHTKEALFAAQGPVALPLAATDGEAPTADDIIVVIIRPGDLVVLDEGIWHDACHGLEQETPYYWYAECDPSIVDPWVTIDGGGVSVSLRAGTH